jgi:nucleoid-associated protein YgaU
MIGPESLAGLVEALPEVIYNQALASAREGRLEQAQAELSAALVLRPQFAEAQLLLGKVGAARGDLRAATRAWEGLLESHPEQEGAREGLAQVRRLRRRQGWGRAAVGVALVLVGGLWLGRGGLERGGTPGGTRAGEGEPAAGRPAPAPAPTPPASLAQATAALAQALASSPEAWLQRLSVAAGPAGVQLTGPCPSPQHQAWLAGLAAQLCRPWPVSAAGLWCPPPLYVVLRRGDTLSQLARRYCGEANRWPEILAANPSLPRDTRAISAGARVLIPGDLLDSARGSAYNPPASAHSPHAVPGASSG